MHVDLLRHGATGAVDRYLGSTDVALGAAGLQQMRAVTRGLHWDRILSSPLQRCAAFAQALAADLGVDCRIDARWRELHFGDWEGRSAAELQQQQPEALGRFWRDPLACPPPGGEPLQSLQQRVLEGWNELLRMPAAPRTLVVTHGGPIRVLLAQARGWDLRRALEIAVPHAVLLSPLADRCPS